MLGDEQVIATTNKNYDHWQIEVIPFDREKTAFTAHHKRYKLKLMWVVLNNKPSTFQRVMDKIFSSVKWKISLISLEYVVISSYIPLQYI